MLQLAIFFPDVESDKGRADAGQLRCGPSARLQNSQLDESLLGRYTPLQHWGLAGPMYLLIDILVGDTTSTR